MARVSNAAGYDLLVMTVQKHDKFGKAWGTLTYYEDTDSVVDELKQSPEAHGVSVVHVQAPGYENCVVRFADRVVSQSEYLREVLE